MELKKPQIEHVIELGDFNKGNKETYIYKFKDRPERAGLRIHNLDGSLMHLQEIRISKVPRKTNKMMIELLKAPEDSEND